MYMAPLSKQDQFYVPETAGTPEPETSKKQWDDNAKEQKSLPTKTGSKPTEALLFHGPSCETAASFDTHVFRSQSVHVVRSDKIESKGIRASSLDTGRTGHYNDLDSSVCSSCSSATESDVSTASSYVSSDYSCSSVNTLHNASVNSDMTKSRLETEQFLEGETLDKEL